MPKNVVNMDEAIKSITPDGTAPAEFVVRCTYNRQIVPSLGIRVE